MGPKAEDELKAQALLAVWAFTVLCLVSYSAAFSHGASLTACTDMRPKHIRAHLQNPHNNYITLHTNMSVFLPGDKIPVTVRSTRDFMGFMLQARRVSNDQIAGTFVYIPPGSKLLACFEDGDTVTHSDKSLKRNLSFVWKAPDQPIGDIRFFLSVVQSYFVYWARIESSTVYQTQNRTAVDRRLPFSAIKPTPFQQSPDLEGGSTAGSSSYTILTQFKNISSTSLTQIAPTLILEPAEYGQRISEFPGKENLPSESLADFVTARAISPNGERQPNGIGPDGDLMLESSFPFQNLGFITQDYSSVHSRYNGTENASSIPTSSLYATSTEVIEVVSESSVWGIWNSALAITSSPLIHLWDPLLLSEEGTTSEYLGRKRNSDASQGLSAAPWQSVEENPVTQKGPANFLPQAELTAHGQEKESKEANILLKVTRAVTEAGAPGDGGAKPGRQPQLVAAQLGVLLGCSVVLGMVLAIGLRCIHSRYCHKRTEVSFSEPENNVIALRESGEMMHFRKIRENSFVLVQAEYNWINPPSSGKKAVM